MKRLLLVLLLVAALATSVVLLLRPTTQASPDVTIIVNSTADTNVRDGPITLREAMMLANGELALAALTDKECTLVSGTTWEHSQCQSSSPPGAASADTIIFNTWLFRPDSPAAISLGSALPTLDTGVDTIDGSSAGVIVNGVSKTFDCISIISARNVIKGLQIRNCLAGVAIDAGQNNTIGGTTAGERNVISGNTVGVRIAWGPTTGNTVKGNYIGTDASGTSAVANYIGVYIWNYAGNNTIGGTTAAERNVISGNEEGVVIVNTISGGNVVRGNYIGTDATGTAALGNTYYGVLMESRADNNTIGGTTAAERNVISGNGKGVAIGGPTTTGDTVKGNYIGTDASGRSAIGNNVGVYIYDRTYDNTIGGIAAGEGNLIAFNDVDGVLVQDLGTTGNTIRGNSIHSNGDMGIHNFDGGNHELAPPVITGVGSALGTACANCTIDVYSDDEDEGRVYEGSTTANGSGDWSLSGSLEGPNVTATATDADGNTSEFSAPVAVSEATPTPSPTPTPTPTPTATRGATPTPAGASRTLLWNPGWHNVTWSGASTPEEAFACAAGRYAAAYRLVNGNWQRYFPGRPDISNMSPLARYDAFLILITQTVTCVMPVTAASGSSRTLQGDVGWHNVGWSGPDGTPLQDAFACAAGNYAAAYRFTDAGLERYFPDRPDVSNMEPLNKYDAFLILLTAPVSCTMPVAQ